MRIRKMHSGGSWAASSGSIGFDPAIAYPERVACVQSAGIAIWDVLKACVREGSLDSAIDAASVVPNDFAAFLAEYSQIRRICFNGATAQALYLKHVRSRLGNDTHLEYLRLPSTSPANASLSFFEKTRAWQAIVPGRSSRPARTARG